MTLEDHEKWLKIYATQIKDLKKKQEEIEQEVREIESMKYSTLAQMQELRSGIPVGSKVSWSESSCNRGCCLQRYEGVVRSKGPHGDYEVIMKSGSISIADLKDLTII